MAKLSMNAVFALLLPCSIAVAASVPEKTALNESTSSNISALTTPSCKPPQCSRAITTARPALAITTLNKTITLLSTSVTNTTTNVTTTSSKNNNNDNSNTDITDNNATTTNFTTDTKITAPNSTTTTTTTSNATSTNYIVNTTSALAPTKSTIATNTTATNTTTAAVTTTVATINSTVIIVTTTNTTITAITNTTTDNATVINTVTANTTTTNKTTTTNPNPSIAISSLPPNISTSFPRTTLHPFTTPENWTECGNETIDFNLTESHTTDCLSNVIYGDALTKHNKTEIIRADVYWRDTVSPSCTRGLRRHRKVVITVVIKLSTGHPLRINGEQLAISVYPRNDECQLEFRRLTCKQPDWDWTLGKYAPVNGKKFGEFIQQLKQMKMTPVYKHCNDAFKKMLFSLITRW